MYSIITSYADSRRLILVTNDALHVPAAYDTMRDNNDNTRHSVSSDSSSTTLKTITSQNYSRPSEALMAEAKVFPVGEHLLAIEQTTHDVIQAHVITNIHSVESVKRGILMHEAINKTHSVRICVFRLQSECLPHRCEFDVVFCPHVRFFLG